MVGDGRQADRERATCCCLPVWLQATLGHGRAVDMCPGVRQWQRAQLPCFSFKECFFMEGVTTQGPFCLRMGL